MIITNKRKNSILKQLKNFAIILLTGFSCFFLSGCSSYLSKEHQAHYKTRESYIKEDSFLQEPFFIIFLVDAPHLDYSSTSHVLKSLVKHPQQSYDGRFGHAWIFLQGIDDHGKIMHFEGGHSGDFGHNEKLTYFEGISQLIDRHDPNPIRYLWTPLNDGILEKGNGGHSPSFALQVVLSHSEYKRLVSWLETHSYPFASYDLQTYQCCRFVEECARVVDIDLDSRFQLHIDSKISFCGQELQMWEDPQFSSITIPMPDQLEYKLISYHNSSRRYAHVTKWYQQHYVKSKPFWDRFKGYLEGSQKRAQIR